MTTETEQADQVQAVQRLLDILEELGENRGAGVTELSTSTGLAKSTVHRYLSTLQDRQYVVKHGEEYALSLRFLDIAERARTGRYGYRMASKKVEQLANETNERCQFVVEEHGRGVYAAVAAGTDAVLTNSHIGTRLYLHTTSVGKAILAHVPETRVSDIVDQWGLPAATRHTITDYGTLCEELDDVRTRGVAFNREENIEGLRSVGAPVLDGSGTPVGAISISGPSHRMKGSWFEEKIPDLLLGATNELELKLEYEGERLDSPKQGSSSPHE